MLMCSWLRLICGTKHGRNMHSSFAEKNPSEEAEMGAMSL